MGINVYCVWYEIKQDGNIRDISITKVLSTSRKAKKEVGRLIEEFKKRYNIKESIIAGDITWLFDYGENMGEADYEIMIQVKKFELE